MSQDGERPDPDSLLAAVQRTEKASGRGHLKIFFGFSPGVGKTFAMLEAARLLQAAGTDVVAGIVETHGREDTARLLDGIEVLPRVEVPYRGHTLLEFDLDGAICRRPGLLLVDELAHTNAPGLRHEKRWQDIRDVLASGIDVHTTLNVQHVESVVDLVEEATGIRVRETVPDTVLAQADEIELIDLPPDELLTRLRDGKIYLPDVARVAVERFFKRSNLLQLRELALVRMAQLAGSDAEAFRGTAGRPRSGVTEKIVVGVGPGHGAARAIRDAARIAAGLRAAWTAVHVRRPTERPPRAATAASLEDNLRMAESLGGRVDRVTGSTIAAGLLAEARRLGATRIVVGRPRPSAWHRLFRESILDGLVRDSGPIDVVIAGSPAGNEKPPVEPTPVVDPVAALVRPGLIVAAVIGVALGLGRMLRPFVDDHDMSLVSLLIVVGATLRFGRAAGILAALLAALGIDLLFIHPEFQFAVADSKELVSLLVLLSTGIVVAELIMRVRSQREFAIAAERRLSRLLDLSRRLAVADAPEQVATVLAATIADVTAAGVDVVLAAPSGELRSAARRGVVEQASADAGVMVWCHEFGAPAGRGMATLPGARISCLPIREMGRGLGVVVIGCTPARDLSRDEVDIVSGAIHQAGVRLVMLTNERHTMAKGDAPPGTG